MRREDRILFAVLAVGCFVVPIALGVAFHWPVGVWATLVIVGLAATGLSARQMIFRRAQQELAVEQERQRAAERERERTAEPPPQGLRMVGVPLPCAEPGYRFLFSAKVFWRPAPNPVGMRHTNPEALALDSIRLRAGHITKDQAPGDHVAVGYQLAAALGTVLPDGSGQVVVWANEVTLSIPDDDAARLGKITQLRKHEQVFEEERGLERGMRSYLRDEVLASPGTAVVWWLARHPDQVEDTARLIGPLAQLSAAAHETPVHEIFRDYTQRDYTQRDYPQRDEPQVPMQAKPALETAHDNINQNAGPDSLNPDSLNPDNAGGLADELFDGREDDAQRRLFGYELAKLVDNHGGPDLAGRIRNTFGVPERPRRLDR